MSLRFRTRSLHPASLLLALSAAMPACVEAPVNGKLSYNPTTPPWGILFKGKHWEPNEPINIQVMNAPDDPNHAAWVTVGTTVSSSTPNYWNQPEPYYEWSIGTVVNDAAGTRWPQGGLLRFRARDAAGVQLYHFDHDAQACFYEHAGLGWMAIGEACQSEFPTAAVVSVTPTPADLSITPKYLSFTENKNAGNGVPGTGSTAEAQEYYDAINAPASLTAFKQEYGFGAPGSDEVSATYFNAGDLGVGREMHCKSFLKPGMSSAGRACYVSNYGDGQVNFGGDKHAALDRAVQGTKSGSHSGAFATVAMAYYPPITAHNSVRFVVYGANGQLAYDAQLDTKGYNKGIPQNCITCHGGAQYDPVNHRVLGASSTQNGARFLAFDVAAFEYSSDPDFTLAAQQEKFRKLNEHVYAAGPAQATKELIEGWYAQGSVHTPGTVADTSFVPATFSATGADTKVYRHVVAPYCRTCHASQRGPLNFVSADDFKAMGLLIDYRVCTRAASNPAQSHLMPNAEVTLQRFWESPARAYLAGYLDSFGTCKP